MTFDQSVRSVLSNYATFEGRAMRSEYWYWVLFTLLVSMGLNLLEAMLQSTGPDMVLAFNLIGLAFSLATLVPSIAVGIRRMHDVGKSGWNILWSLTIIGVLYVLYLYVQPSQPGANAYGAQPVGTTATAA